MRSYEKELLALAVDAHRARFEGAYFGKLDIVTWDNGHVRILSSGSQTHLAESVQTEGATLADALTALLADLGVEVPERPSAERVAELWDDVSRKSDGFAPWVTLADLRDLYAREPLTVLALLEGGAA